MRKVVGDLVIEDNTSATGGKNNKANNKCAKIKCHVYIIKFFRGTGKGLKFLRK